LDRLGFLTRSQIQKLHDLKSARNANRILYNMSPYLNSFRLHENVYYLNKKGREMINSNKVMSRNMQVQHILMRNEAYIFFGCPKKWGVEEAIKDAQGNVFIRPDVIFAVEENDRERFYFLEIDYMQKMINNKKKIEKYASLQEKNLLQRSLGYFPTVIFITVSDIRKQKLAKECQRHGVPYQIYTLDEIK
jgi:hypothetical protein